MSKAIHLTRKYALFPAIFMTVAIIALVATPHAADIGVTIGMSGAKIKQLYIALFFVSHLIFFAPFASVKEPYRMVIYGAVFFFAIYGSLDRYDNVLKHPDKYMRHDIFIRPVELMSAI